MHEKDNIQIVRTDDFVAESLEVIANGLPPSEAERARELRERTQQLRNSDSIQSIELEVIHPTAEPDL